MHVPMIVLTRYELADLCYRQQPFLDVFAPGLATTSCSPDGFANVPAALRPYASRIHYIGNGLSKKSWLRCSSHSPAHELLNFTVLNLV